MKENQIFDPDIIKMPAGAGNFASIHNGFSEAMCKAIVMMIALHKIKLVVLLNHQQCGAYSYFGHEFEKEKLSDDERDFHLREMEIAQKFIEKILADHAFNHVQVRGGLLWVDSQDQLGIAWARQKSKHA